MSSRGTELRTASDKLAKGSTSREVPRMSSRSATGKSARCSRNLGGSGSPKNTMSGFTTPAQTRQRGTLSTITSAWATGGERPEEAVTTHLRGKGKTHTGRPAGTVVQWSPLRGEPRFSNYRHLSGFISHNPPELGRLPYLKADPGVTRHLAHGSLRPAPGGSSQILRC
uniref:NAD-dependent protein deacetylase sirtuin-3, mitochondrial n=1 Tax=Sus scrofa TaxID=9823 RepID=A0A480J988_PIG